MRSRDFTLWMRKYFCVAAVGSKTMSDPLWFEQNATVMIPGCEGATRVKRGMEFMISGTVPLRCNQEMMVMMMRRRKRRRRIRMMTIKDQFWMQVLPNFQWFALKFQHYLSWSLEWLADKRWIMEGAIPSLLNDGFPHYSMVNKLLLIMIEIIR